MIIKSIELPTGVTCEAHDIVFLPIDRTTDSATIRVQSWLDQAAHDAGKQPVMTTEVPVSGISGHFPGANALFEQLVMGAANSIFAGGTQV